MDVHRPILLVDIDGVLNPWGFEVRPEGFCEYEFLPDKDPVLLASVHGVWLRELSAEFDLVWASGWGDNAGLVARALDLAAMPHVPMPPTLASAQDKVPAIAAYVSDRPTAWVDDDMTDPARRWAEQRHVPTLLIEIDHCVGLTRPEVDRLLSWARGLR